MYYILDKLDYGKFTKIRMKFKYIYLDVYQIRKIAYCLLGVTWQFFISTILKIFKNKFKIQHNKHYQYQSHRMSIKYHEIWWTIHYTSYVNILKLMIINTWSSNTWIVWNLIIWLSMLSMTYL